MKNDNKSKNGIGPLAKLAIGAVSVFSVIYTGLDLYNKATDLNYHRNTDSDFYFMQRYRSINEPYRIVDYKEDSKGTIQRNLDAKIVVFENGIFVSATSKKGQDSTLYGGKIPVIKQRKSMHQIIGEENMKETLKKYNVKSVGELYQKYGHRLE